MAGIAILAGAACSTPGELVAFVELGSVRAGHAIPPAELDDTQARAALVEALDNAGADRPEQWREALRPHAGPGMLAFAFVLQGCAETGAVLRVDGETITAELTDNTDTVTVCEAPQYFLAVFHVDEAAIPEEPHLGT